MIAPPAVTFADKLSQRRDAGILRTAAFGAAPERHERELGYGRFRALDLRYQAAVPVEAGALPSPLCLSTNLTASGRTAS